MQRTRPIIWDIYEEHLDEAAFLWPTWGRALCAANYTLREVAEGPEERLLAHLDGLVLGGRGVAEHLLLPALSDDDLGRVSSAAWALLQAEDADHFEIVWAALISARDRPSRHALSRAVELADRPDLPRRLFERLQNATPEITACIIDAIAGRGQAEAGALPLRDFASETHADVLRAVLRAAQCQNDLAASRAMIERSLRQESGETLEAAIEAGALLETKTTLAACRRVVAERAPNLRLSMGILALSGEVRDRARLIEWSRVPDVETDALWALGFTGRMDVAELLLERLDDAKAAPLAAEAFSSITGLVIEGALVKPGEPSILMDSFDDAGPVPEVRPEHELPVPQPEPIRRWWDCNKSRFESHTRHSFGAPWTVHAVNAAMLRAPMWRRQVLRLGLGATLASRIDLRQWARRQYRDANGRHL